QEAASERREWHQPDAELAQEGDGLRSQIALPQRILAWQPGHRKRCLRPPDVPRPRLGEAEEADLALPHQFADRTRHVLDRNGRINPVLIDEVDTVGAQAAQAAFDRLTDALGPAVHLPGHLLAALEAEAELGGEHDLVASPFESPTDQFLVDERTVDLRGVEKGAAKLDRAMDRGDRLGLVGRAVGLAHAHAAESDARDLQALAPESALAHGHRSDPPLLGPEAC